MAAAAGTPRPGELLDRFLARLIDGLIMAIPYGIFYAILASIFLSGFSNSLGEVLVFNLFMSLISTAIFLGYYAFLESSRGQTIGKQLMKLKVFGPDGASNPTMEQAIRRNIFLALGLLAIVPILGTLLNVVASIGAIILIVIGINKPPTRQHWFDEFAGGTQVMKVG